jgi:quercetin dioxygenase-like cupin family protein
MVWAALRRTLVGTAAVAAALGWLQLSPAFGAPATAPAGMFDRLFGIDREAGLAGWALLLVGEALVVAFYFLFLERRASGPIAPIAFAIGAWVITGAVVMPLVGALQPPLANDPMRVSFFMLNLGPGAAAASLVGWLIFGTVLAAGRTLNVSRTAFGLAVGAAALGAAIALAMPALALAGGSGRVVEGRVAGLPSPAPFISVLELPQPPGAVLGPHTHVPGFVADVSGVATMAITGKVVDVGPGDGFFIPNVVEHDHQNRAAVPIAVAVALLILGSTVAVALRGARRLGVPLMSILLVAGTVATIDPFMNRWYFVAVRPGAQRGAAMPVPAGHRTYESATLTNLASWPHEERLFDQRLAPGASTRVSGPAAVVVLDGQVSVMLEGRQTALAAQAGVTVQSGTDATVQAGSGSARVLIVQLLPAP